MWSDPNGTVLVPSYNNLWPANLLAVRPEIASSFLLFSLFLSVSLFSKQISEGRLLTRSLEIDANF